MKNSFLILVFSTIVLNSCVDQDSSDIEYTIFNETDKTVNVLGFNTSVIGNNGRADPILIEPNSYYSVTKTTGLDNTSLQRFYSIQGVDSIRIIFNDEKVKIFGGINDYTPYDIFTGGEDKKAFITQQDYEDAIDCNDDCE